MTIEPFIADPERAGIFLDFDGTLSPIVDRPSDARPVPGAAEVLSRLNSHFAVAALVSGRSAREVLDWLGPEVEIWGLHGAEHTVNGEVVLSERAKPYVAMMKEVFRRCGRALDELALEGVILEDKGVIVTLHYRTAKEPGRAASELGRLADRLVSDLGLIKAEGKMSLELRPPVEFAKSTVVLERALELRLRAVAFGGDDVVDLPGYDALDALAERGLATLRIAVDSDEAPSELLARADVVVPGPGAMVEWLSVLQGSNS
jgi:trehalose 6-phosphate phosphatase